VIDREGNETELFYEDENREHFLTRIEDPLGRDGVRTTYNDDGRLEKVIDVDGKEIELVYDSTNSLQTVYDVFDRPTTYIYDNRGNVLTEIDQVGKKTNRTYNDRNEMESETVTIQEDDGTGNMVEVSQTTTFTYDNNGNLLTETDPLGNTQRYTYNQRGQLLTSTDPLGNTTSYTFSPRGNVLSKTDAEGNTVTYRYDLRGNPLSITEGENDVTRFRYNEFGDRIEKIDAEGTKTTYDREYNEIGKIETETTTRTTPQGTETLITVRQYDKEDNLISLLDPENGLTQYQYDANGNQTHIIDAEGRVTEMKYDEKNQLIETIYPDNDTDPNNNPKASIQYDEAGNRTAIIDPEGNITAYTYDPLNRPSGMLIPDDNDDINDPTTFNDNDKVEIIYNQAGQMTAMVDHRGNRSEYEYDDAGRMTVVRTFEDGQIYETKTTYDKAGRETSQIDALGRKTEYKYDQLGQLIATIFHDGTSIKNEYDPFGNLIARTDQAGQTIQYKYDTLDRLLEVIDPALQSTIYQYDEAGNLIYQKDVEGQETRFEYNNLGQQIAIKRPLEPAATTTYDKVGNIQTTTDFNGDTIHYQYNEENRLIAKTLEGETDPFIEYQYHATGQLHKVQDARGETEYLYNERGLLESRTEPDGSFISYTYNEAGLPETVTTPTGTTTYQYDKMNRLEKVIEPDSQETIYTYDAVGNLKTTTYANGVVETNDYDDLNRLTGVTYKDENDNIISSYEYTLDNAGNRKVVEENNGRKVEYDYDELYRLKKEIITDPLQGDVTLEYDYDKVGNRTSMKVTTAQGTVETTYQYDDNDRLLSESTNGVTTNYTYDQNGNLTFTDVVGSLEEVEYIWDEENRLIEVNVTDAAGMTQNVKYEYDAQGIRVSETIDGETTKYLIDTVRPYAQVLEEYTGEGANRNVEASYLYGNDLISQQQGTEELFYLEDGHSGVRQLVDENGMVTDSYSYDAYGNLLGSMGTNENDYLYRGEQFDESLDLQYLRARYYDPTTGRFISTDPFEGVLEQPVSRHRYLYGNSNPVTFSDPSGLVTMQDIQATFTLNSVIRGLNLVGLTFGPAQLIGSQLAGIDRDSIKWSGYQLSGDIPIKGKPKLPKFTGLGADLYLVNSVAFDGNDTNLQQRWGLVATIHSNYGYNSPQTPSFTAGTFTIWSPNSLGDSIYLALGGGFMAAGGTIFGGFSKDSVGAGKAHQYLSIGFARGNAHGWGFSRGRGISGEIQLGISIPFFLTSELTLPTPSDVVGY
jgi:RHS repeat-associated protein